MHPVASRKPNLPLRSRVKLSTRFFACNVPVASIVDFVPSSTTTAPLDSRTTSQMERASMPHSVQGSNDSVVSRCVLVSPFASVVHGLLFLLNNAKKNLADYKEKLRDGKTEKNFYWTIFGCWDQIMGFSKQKKTFWSQQWKMFFHNLQNKRKSGSTLNYWCSIRRNCFQVLSNLSK